METIAANGTPLAAYLEGEGHLNTSFGDNDDSEQHDNPEADKHAARSFAPSSNGDTRKKVPHRTLSRSQHRHVRAQSAVSRFHNAFSTALNSRLGRADNNRFIEHFRYIIVASQLLNEYLDQGALPPPLVSSHGLDGQSDAKVSPSVATSLYGAAATAAVAFALVYLIHWARNGRDGTLSKSRIALVILVFIVVGMVGYVLVRRQWLLFLRQNAVTDVTTMTSNWQAFEVSSGSALSLIQEVELVSKGYRLSTPLPPASRVEDQAVSRRCVRLRRTLHKSYSAIIPACTETCNILKELIDVDDLERYFEIYDISLQDVREAMGPDALTVLDDDAESLKSLRVLSYRAGVLRRATLCSLMALEADGGKPDFYRWRIANGAMSTVSGAIGISAEKLQQCLSDMETVSTPTTPAPTKLPSGPGRERMRGQVRKISMLSSGIRGLQAKMQILREETNRAIDQSDDLTDLGPGLMAQYEAIGTDLKDLMQAWETGKASLQSNLTKHERRISLASTRSPVSSIGGLTAVEEGGGPADALKALNGDTLSNRSSMATTPSDEEVFEAVAVPKQRSTLSRDERIIKMQEERERQAILRAKRDANTSMMRELESVINLRPKKTGPARITSI